MTVILCLDAGNSRLKWGLRDGDHWRARGVAADGDLAELAGVRFDPMPDAVVACNVAGPAAEAEIIALAARLGAPLHWLRSTAAAGGVSNGYARPEQLGADRWAALIGARALHGGDAVVVMAGTATTIDLLDAGGRFRGGLILPGLALMRAALARDTANLPDLSAADGRYREVPDDLVPDNMVPDNTDDAIVAGSLHATLGAIARMRAALASAAGGDATVLLSGGAAHELAPHLPQPARSVENLVLEGLARYPRIAADI